MAKTTSETDRKEAAKHMRTIANDGYLAYIEWPVFLAHRLKQVEQHLSIKAAPTPEPSPQNPAAAAPLPKQPPALRSKAKASVAATVVQPQAETSVPAVLPVPQAAVPPTAAAGSAESDLLSFIGNFDMQGES